MPTATLLRFARLVTETASDAELLPLLATGVRELGAADASVVLRAGEDDLRVVATEGLHDALRDFRADADELGEPLAAALLAATSDRFVEARALPLVSSGALFGVAVLLYADASAVTPQRLSAVAGVVDLAAAALFKAAQVEQLQKSHAELRASQEALLRTERLRVVGQMAAGITHDLKNLLNPLSLHLQVAQRAIAANDLATAATSITEMRSALKRGVEVIDRLRSFSREDTSAVPPLADVNRLVHDAAQLAKPRAASRGLRVSAIVEELGAPPPVRVHAGEVVSAVLNLVVNAVDAMGQEGGTVTLRTGEERDGAWIEVADTGPGMTPEVQRRVFEPFFTTKGDGGTGLGLAMVYACVEAHRGAITLRTAPGEGATFRLWFPGSA